MSTDKIPLIYARMADINNEIDAIGKNRFNEQQKFKFRSIDDVYNAVNPLFKRYRIFMTSKILEEKREERPSKNGGTNIWTILKIEWTFFAEDGSFVTTQSQGEGMDSGDKGSNKAMSTSQKYAIIQAFSIPVEEGHPDSDKDVLFDNKEIEEIKLEVRKFTSSKELTEWANNYTEIHGNKDLVNFIQLQIKDLKRKGL